MRDFETGLDAVYLRDHFEYLPETGHFIRLWPVMGGVGRRSIQDWPGDRAGTKSGSGYRHLSINRRLYMEHRLAWLYMTGSWPNLEIDHRNGIRDDNRFANLREVTVSQNRMNSLGQKRRVGPYPGVYQTKDGVFAAQIKFQGRVIPLGTHLTAEIAREVRIAAEKQYFGEYRGSAREL